MKKGDMKDVLKTNLKLFGVRYIFWDILYQFFRILHRKFYFKKQGLKEKRLIIKNVNGHKMIIDKNGEGIHRDLYLKGVREPESTKIMVSLLKKGDVVLEAGANIGYYVILESKQVGNKGKIYAVEPIKDNFELLKKNIKLNNLKNVRTYQKAFNNRDGVLKINISVEGNRNTPAEIKNSIRTDTVNGVTIDNFFKNKKKPRVMRMDIDGFEDRVFEGSINTLDFLEVIFVELHFPMIEKQKMVSLLRSLEKKNFDVYRAVLEWERTEDDKNILGKLTNFFYNKRSRPIIFDNLTIPKLINSEIINSHLSLEVFFVKK